MGTIKGEEGVIIMFEFETEKEMELYFRDQREQFIDMLKKIYEGVEDIEYIGCQVPINERKDIIDMLFKINNCLGYQYIVIELKNKVAPLKTLSQIARYMEHLKETIESNTNKKRFIPWKNETYGLIVAPKLCKESVEYLNNNPSSRIKGLSLLEGKVYG